MCQVSFKRITPEESRIFADGDYVGDVYRQPDILSSGAVFYVIHLEDDPRGFVRVHERSRIREVTEQRVRSHPLWG